MVSLPYFEISQSQNQCKGMASQCLPFYDWYCYNNKALFYFEYQRYEINYARLNKKENINPLTAESHLVGFPGWQRRATRVAFNSGNLFQFITELELPESSIKHSYSRRVQYFQSYPRCLPHTDGCDAMMSHSSELNFCRLVDLCYLIIFLHF